MKKASLLHQESSVTRFTLELIQRGFHYQKKEDILNPKRFKSSFIVYHGHTTRWYGDWEEFLAMGEKVMDLLKNDPKFSEQILNETIKRGKLLYKKNEELQEKDISTLSNEEIAKQIESIYNLGGELCEIGLIPVVSDLRHDMLSSLLKEILKKKVKKKKAVNDFFSTLVTPNKKTFNIKEKEKMLEILEKKDGSELLEKKYGWLTFGHRGPKKTAEEYAQELKEIKSNPELKKGIQNLIKEREKLKELQEKIEKELNLKENEITYFKAARDFSFSKSYRYDTLLFTFSILDAFLGEIAKRTHLEKADLRVMSLEEVMKTIRGEEAVAKEDLKKRKKKCAGIVNGDDIQSLGGEKAKAYEESHAKAEELNKNRTRIHGNVAYMGIVSGAVKIVNSAKDCEKVNEGDILVSIQTIPDLLPAMEKAAAFVTDVGGITSHAAIIAREFKKPCIIGTKIATKLLKDGDLVEVDAENGWVKRL
jgi:phosphohistidine swiveling domain-containing protein